MRTMDYENKGLLHKWRWNNQFKIYIVLSKINIRQIKRLNINKKQKKIKDDIGD